LQERWVFGRSQDPMCGLLEIFGLGKVDIRHKLLRIAIDDWEPRALNLDHQAMAFRKAMQHVQ
jgi:hypothetical protein